MMLILSRLLSGLCLILVIIFPSVSFAGKSIDIPILCYHNFNPTVPGSMNLTPDRLEEQLRWLKNNGFTVIPLKVAVEYLQGARVSLPNKPVVITADDGWQSVYTYMYPLARKYNIPVTLFIYPTTISRSKHAMTWSELRELQQTGLFDIQGHTYWHPNFIQEKKQLSSLEYQKLVKVQLVNSKRIIENKLGIKISFLAWPFGIYDKYLENEAEKAGYTMAFTVDDSVANASYRPMAQPRLKVVEDESMQTFAKLMNNANRGKSK